MRTAGLLRTIGVLPGIGCVLLGMLGLASTPASAGCLSLISGPIVYDVAGCKLIEPEGLFDTRKEKFAWIGNLDESGRKKFYDSYRGLYLKGKVVKSKAILRGLNAEDGALSGDVVYMYLPPSPTACASLLGKRLSANLRQVCCEGGGDAPCLLNTSYLLLGAKVLPAGAGDQTKAKARRSKDYLAGDAAFQQRRYKEAVKQFEKARVNGELDIAGHYHLAFAHRSLDQCPAAMAPLRYIAEQQQKKQIWADDEADARKAQFLMARCYAKMNDPQNAVLILNSYLLEPNKYRSELEDSLKGGDFGWIHTSREYRDYSKDARKRLQTVK